MADRCQNCYQNEVRKYGDDYICSNCGWSYYKVKGKLIPKRQMQMGIFKREGGIFGPNKEILKEGYKGYNAVMKLKDIDVRLLLEIANNYSLYKETDPDLIKKIERASQRAGCTPHRMWTYLRYRERMRNPRARIKRFGITEAKEQIVKKVRRGTKVVKRREDSERKYIEEEKKRRKEAEKRERQAREELERAQRGRDTGGGQGDRGGDTGGGTGDQDRDDYQRFIKDAVDRFLDSKKFRPSQRDQIINIVIVLFMRNFPEFRRGGVSRKEIEDIYRPDIEDAINDWEQRKRAEAKNITDEDLWKYLERKWRSPPEGEKHEYKKAMEEAKKESEKKPPWAKKNWSKKKWWEQTEEREKWYKKQREFYKRRKADQKRKLKDLSEKYKKGKLSRGEYARKKEEIKGTRRGLKKELREKRTEAYGMTNEQYRKYLEKQKEAKEKERELNKELVRLSNEHGERLQELDKSYRNLHKDLKDKLDNGEIDETEYSRQKQELEGNQSSDEEQINRDIEQRKNEVKTRLGSEKESAEKAAAGHKKQRWWNLPLRAGRFSGRGIRHIEKGRKSYAPQIMEVFFALALALAGIIISVFTNSFYFALAFLSVALHLVIPDAHYFKPTPGAFGINPMRDSHSALASLKSLLKISAIIMFALAFKDLGDLFNIAFIATVFIGYYMLAIEYENHAEFLESLLRFVFLGAYFIPFVVFGSIFNSWVLVAIALAFFAIPPIPKPSVDIGKALTRGLSGATAYYEFFDKIFFVGLMLFALAGSGTFFPSLFGASGWELAGTLKATFIWFWAVSLISGIFSPAEVRPMTGMLMLGGATVIYGVGPGSQEIGSALLGQWWPTVNEAIQTITEPIADVFGQLGNTFGNAFLLLTNPVGYATQLLNGSYSTNPYGPTGAFGVELEDVEVSPIFIQQPFLITTKVKNVGSHVAKNVHINLQVGLEKPSAGPSSDVRVKPLPSKFPRIGGDVFFIPLTPFNRDFLSIKDIGLTEGCIDAPANVGEGKQQSALDAGICIKKVADTLTQQDIRQVVFTSTGVPARTVRDFDLRKKSLPLFIMLTYDYEADSSLTIEFISQSEWDRLAKEDSLVLHKSIPQVSTSPLQFPIGTLEQPILVQGRNSSVSGTPFFLGLKLQSNEGKDSLIEQVMRVELEYPEEFGDPANCTPELGASSRSTTKGTRVLSWTNATHPEILGAQGSKTIICTFEPLDEDVLGGAPLKTFLVEAHAEYQFQRWERKLTKIEIGGFCASKEDCLKGQDCVRGVCVPEGTQITPVNGNGTGKLGDDDYCSTLKQVNPDDKTRWCVHGEGGCTPSADECRSPIQNSDGSQTEFLCFNKEDIPKHPDHPDFNLGVNLCCQSNVNLTDCLEQYIDFGGPSVAAPEPPEPTPLPPIGSDNYCEIKKQNSINDSTEWCSNGEGNCNPAGDECRAPVQNSDGSQSQFLCTKKEDIPTYPDYQNFTLTVNLCCQTNANLTTCLEQYLDFLGPINGSS